MRPSSSARVDCIASPRGLNSTDSNRICGEYGGRNRTVLGSLSHRARIAGRPQYKNCLSVNECALDGAKCAAIGGYAAMVAHHEVAVRGDYGLGIGTVVTVLIRDIRLR